MKVQTASEKYVDFLEKHTLHLIDENELVALMDAIDEIKAFADTKEFEDLYFDTVQASLLTFEMDFVKIVMSPVRTEEERIAKMVDWIMAHRYWLFTLAGYINAIRLTILRAIGKWPKEMLEQIVVPSKKEIPVDKEKYEALLDNEIEKCIILK